MPSKNPTIGVRMPVWMYQRVHELASLQGVSDAEIARQALHQFFSRLDIYAPGTAPRNDAA